MFNSYVRNYTAGKHHVAKDQYLLIPFTSYFDVHQGYKVLTHPYVNIM